MEPEPKSSLDYGTIGRRIRDRRKKLGLSAAELAERAGVARYTVVRLEQGKATTKASLAKIRRGLGLFTDQMTRPYEVGPFAVHRSAETRWSVALPKATYQKQVENDDPIHVDEEAERRRLGNLGFQPFFTAVLGTELSEGVSSHALMEFHRASWVDQHSGEEFIYCLRGSITITVDGTPCQLEEGDAMSFDGRLPHQYAPTHELKPADPPVLILIVVSHRPGEKAIIKKPREPR